MSSSYPMTNKHLRFKPDKEGEIQYTGISQSAIREMSLCSELSHLNVVHTHEIILEDKCIYTCIRIRRARSTPNHPLSHSTKSAGHSGSNGQIHHVPVAARPAVPSSELGHASRPEACQYHGNKHRRGEDWRSWPSAPFFASPFIRYIRAIRSL